MPKILRSLNSKMSVLWCGVLWCNSLSKLRPPLVIKHFCLRTQHLAQLATYNTPPNLSWSRTTIYQLATNSWCCRCPHKTTDTCSGSGFLVLVAKMLEERCVIRSKQCSHSGAGIHSCTWHVYILCPHQHHPSELLRGKGCLWSFATQNTFSAGFQKCLLFLTGDAFPWLQTGEEYQHTVSTEDVKKEWLVYLSGTGGTSILPLTQVGIKSRYASARWIFIGKCSQYLSWAFIFLYMEGKYLQNSWTEYLELPIPWQYSVLTESWSSPLFSKFSKEAVLQVCWHSAPAPVNRTELVLGHTQGHQPSALPGGMANM